MTTLTLTIASTLDDKAPIAIAPETLFGRHCAIVGSSGGGKSCSLARIIEQASEHRSKLLLFDASGEYEGMAGKTFHIHIGEAKRQDCNSISATVPYFELSENDLLGIFQPQDTVQWVKLRAAIKTLKLLHLCPALARSGNFPKAHRHKLQYEEALSMYQKQLERPDSIFNIHKLPLQIDLECVEPVRSHAEADYWGAVSAREQTSCISLINRIEDLLKTPELRYLFNPPARPSAFEAIEKFITDPGVSVLRISLEFLPMAHEIRRIVTDSLARHLLSLGRAGALQRCPIVIALDEAHQVLSRPSNEVNAMLPPSAFELIAKEGRKYGLTLCLATQRPADIPESLLSQVGVFIVHRIVGGSDRTAVELASGGLDETSKSLLSTLEPGQAIILGVGIREPRRVRMLAPSVMPRSHGPDYQSAWSTKREEVASPTESKLGQNSLCSGGSSPTLLKSGE
jgi:hypothetical protein